MVNSHMLSRDIRACFVTGGTGFIGSHLVEFLVGQGKEVRCLVRDPSRLGWLEGKPVQLVPGDLDSLEALREGIEGTEAVFHLAGAIAAGSREEYFRVNAQGCRNAALAALECDHPPDVFLYVSSQAASGPSMPGRAVREEDSPSPVTDYGRSKLEGEKILGSFERLPLVVVRPPTVIGPRDTEALAFFRLSGLGVFPVTNRNSMLNLIFIQDLVEGIFRAATSGRLGETYFIAHGEPVAMEDLAGLMADALGRKVRGLNLPRPVLSAAASLAEVWGRMSGKAPVFNRDKLNELTATGWLCSTEKANRELGFTAKVPVEMALHETVRWYRENSWLT